MVGIIFLMLNGKNNYKDESIAILNLASKFFLWNERLKDSTLCKKSHIFLTNFQVR